MSEYAVCLAAGVLAALSLPAYLSFITRLVAYHYTTGKLQAHEDASVRALRKLKQTFAKPNTGEK